MSNTNRLARVCLPLSVLLLAAGCATSTPPKTSGFLPDYSRLQQQAAPGGGTRLVYQNPRFTPAHYQAIKLDPVQYYPKPQPSADVSMETLTKIRQAVDKSLRQKLGQQVRLVDRAGPGVAHVRVAVTAVGSETRSLKAYQFIPVALVITGAKAAAQGGLPKDATIALETSVTDSESGELLYAGVRGGTGERIEEAAQGKGGVQLSDLQPLIDEWSAGAASSIRRYVKGK